MLQYLAQLVGRSSDHELALVIDVGVRVEKNAAGGSEERLSFSNLRLEKLGVDGAVINVEESDVAIDEPMQEDDELHDVGRGHGPERIASFTEVERDEAREGIRERVGVEIVFEWVVAVVAVERDLDIVVFAPVRRENLAHLVAEIALHLEHEPADATRGIKALVGKELLGEWAHAARRLAGPDGAEDCNSSEQTALRDGEPCGIGNRRRCRCVVKLAENECQPRSSLRYRVWRKLGGVDVPGRPSVHEDVEQQEDRRVRDEGCREEHERQRVTGPGVDGEASLRDDLHVLVPRRPCISAV